MAAPEPGSSGSTSSTEAPAVMSASACCCIVLVLPWALSILKSLELSPAAWNASFRYGASNSTYRAEDVVSGSRTPIMPLPLEARPFSFCISVNWTLNADALRFGTLTLPPELPLELPPDEPQAAATVRTTPARTQPSSRLREFPIAMPSHCHGQMTHTAPLYLSAPCAQTF